MGLMGQMICDGCHAFGPELLLGGGIGYSHETRRCKRCAGLVSVPYAEMDRDTHEWRMLSRRGRCRNEIDAQGTICGSQALAEIPEPDEGDPDDEDWEPANEADELAMPCHRCGGTMRFQSTGIWD